MLKTACLFACRNSNFPHLIIITLSYNNTPTTACLSIFLCLFPRFICGENASSTVWLFLSRNFLSSSLTDTTLCLSPSPRLITLFSYSQKNQHVCTYVCHYWSSEGIPSLSSRRLESSAKKPAGILSLSCSLSHRAVSDIKKCQRAPLIFLMCLSFSLSV